MNIRTAEKVRVPSFHFKSLRLYSFWSGQLIVPAILSPSFVIVRVDVRCCSPILYSHFHVPTGSAFSPCALARPQNTSTNAAERIVFIFALQKVAGGKLSAADCLQPATITLRISRLLVRMVWPSASSRGE